MADPMTSKKALEDLHTIREVIDRTTGAKVVCHFIYRMGTLMIFFGLTVLCASSVHYYVIANYSVTPHITKIFIGMWVSIMVVFACIKAYYFYRNGKLNNMTFIQNYKKIVNKSFLMIDIPIELMAMFYGIFFLKIGHPEYILTGGLMWVGVLFTLLGAVFFERYLTIAGYIYIVSSGIGLLFLNNHLLLFTALNFGVLSIIFGFFMKKHYKEYQKQQGSCA